MALPAGFVLEDEPTVALPPGFELEDGAAPQRASFGAGVARGAASLADTTLGSVIPGAVQFLGYPLARLGRTPEEAQAATKRISAPFEQPFGRALGVTETPEYQQEASRQLIDFIGQNFQKGAKFISEQTGLAQPDVENIIGSLTMAAPKALPAAARIVSEAAAPVIERAGIAARMPFEQQIQARRERMSLEDYARGPQIDAAAEAQRLGIALNPVDIQDTMGTRFTAATAGPRGPEALARANKNQIRNIALADLNLPKTTQLDSTASFNQARLKVAGPYSEVRKLPVQTADAAIVNALEALRPDKSLIGKEASATTMNKLVDDALKKTQGGLTGAELLDNISSLRKDAQRTYKSPSSTPAQIDVADTNLAIASQLESMIDSSIFNPKLLTRYRDARQKMARTYVYEGATDLNTGIVDVAKLARITAKDNALTGDVASLGKIAGNFPEVFSAAPTPGVLSAPRLSRSGAGGAAGALIGSQFGLTGSILGGALGGLATEGLGAFQASRMASPQYQAGLRLRDARIPVSQTAAAMQPIPNSQALVPYQAPVEVLMPGEGPYQPNFVMQPNQYGPRVTTPGFAPGPAQLPAPSAQGTMGTLRAEDVRRAQMSRTLGQQAEAQQAAAEAAARRPTSGAVELQINPLTGAPEVATGIRGATPATFQDFGTSLKSATDKAAAGRMFDLTAAEKVAFDKTRVDLAEVVPGMRSLSDKAIAGKIQDREWVQDAIGKARDKAAGFAEVAARAKDAQARQTAIANRERMMDLVADLEEALRGGRPDTSGKQQGPKTRAAFREGLFSSPPAPPMQPPSSSLFNRR
jgi:CheY-like chemotaxis protein